MPVRPNYPQRGQGPAGGLADGAVGTSEIADAAIVSPKVGTAAIGPTGLASSAVTTVKINDAAVVSPKLGTNAVGPTAIASGAVIQPKLGADSAGLTAVADPIRRRTMTVLCGSAVTAATNYPVLRGGAEAPQITGCYVNAGVQMYHAAGEADTWIFQLRNTTKGLNLVKNNASLSNQTLTATAWKTLPMNNGNSTVSSGNSLQLQLTESGTAQTIDRLAVLIEWQPTVNT